MRNRTFAVVAALLLYQLALIAASPAADEKKRAATATEPSDAVWRFDTHG